MGRRPQIIGKTGFDILVSNNGGPVRLLLNQIGARNHWLTVRVEQGGGNRLAIGARVGVDRGGRPTLWRRVRTDGSYLSASDVRAHFGLGPSASIDALVVIWPDGSGERWTGIERRAVTIRRHREGRPRNTTFHQHDLTTGRPQDDVHA